MKDTQDAQASILSQSALQTGPVWTLSGAHLFNDLMTTGMVPALLPVFKEVFHLSYAVAGLIVLASYLTSSIVQPLFGLATDRKSRTWLLPVGVLCSGLGLAVVGMTSSLPLLFLAIMISGLGSGAFHPEASRGAHLAAGRGKGLAQSIFQVGGNMGQALGPLIVSIFILRTGIHGLTWFVIPAALVAWLTWRLLPWYKGRIEQEKRVVKNRAGRNHSVGMTLLVIVVMLRSWAQIGVAGFLPFLYLRQHIPLADGELFTFLFLTAGAIATFIGGILSDHLGKKWMIAGSMLLSIPFAYLLPHATGVWASVDLFALGFTILSSFAVTVVYGQMLLPSRIGMASGLIIGVAVGAGGIGATLFGWFADQYGLSALFSLVVLLPILATVLAVWLPSDKRLRESL